MKKFWVFFIILIIGCGSSGTGKPTLHPAKGKVTLGSGAPLASGTLALEPAGPGAFRCSGKIGSDGTFELETGTEKGASEGKYKAFVVLPPNRRVGIPKKYLDDSSSDLQIEIVSGDNTLDIKLK